MLAVSVSQLRTALFKTSIRTLNLPIGVRDGTLCIVCLPITNKRLDNSTDIWKSHSPLPRFYWLLKNVHSLKLRPMKLRLKHLGTVALRFWSIIKSKYNQRVKQYLFYKLLEAKSRQQATRASFLPRISPCAVLIMFFRRLIFEGQRWSTGCCEWLCVRDAWRDIIPTISRRLEPTQFNWTWLDHRSLVQSTAHRPRLDRLSVASCYK